jgi:uncharacterized protein
MATGPSDAALSGVQIAVMCKAPIAGLAKTRLIPALGAAGAARVQRDLARMTVRTAMAARLGPVTVWCTPNPQHRFFRALHKAIGVHCLAQPRGDLGARMHTAFRLHCPRGPLVMIGTDCPALQPAHLREAARVLLEGDDAVFIPAEDGGYVLIGLRRPQPALFAGMPWSTDQVMALTRARAAGAGLALRELPRLWDVDRPEDLPRLRKWLESR